ncbi:putative gag-pol polyprotein [Tanacetum coccineum]
MSSKIQDVIHDNQWMWPHDWDLKYPTLSSINVPAIDSNIMDTLEWRNLSGASLNFSVVTVWECIRPRDDEVNWYDVVWFSNFIPRHAFHLWLVMKRKLKTQDTLRQWDVSSNANLNLLQCSLCESQLDSHDHLFFECVFVTFCILRQDEFQYHHLCEQQRIINLCFADDLFLFARGHPSSVSVIMDALEEFKQVSGLVPSIPKSTAYFCNVPNAIKASILNSMPFAKGVLPVRYLGVPLISSILLFRDCKILVEKLESRVNDWRNKFLSLAGRLQLIRSVLSSMDIYWASVFILPSRIVHDLEQLMRGFLWCQGEMKKGKAKVAWDSVCMPKHEGGLGIRRIEDFNISLMATHIWSIFTHRESLWVKLVHTYKLKGRSFWDVPCRGDASWRWHRWTDVCPLKDLLSNRDILHVPVLLDDMDDVILWRDRDGVLRPFSVACVWDTIRSRADMQKLKTQDRLRQWDVGPSINLHLLRCPLCDLVPDSHDHLFFECSFSSHIWSQVGALYGMDSISHRLADVITFIVPISKGKTVISILSRIMVAATSYYIWLERNGRLFKEKTSSPDQIVSVILSMVRLKLVTFKFKICLPGLVCCLTNGRFQAIVLLMMGVLGEG